jgi:tRNA 5-methylaminomethyl-2-thiouridine biosynthesis bifunctional protein
MESGLEIVQISSEPVTWLADGSPHSARFNDRYRSRSGGLAQACVVFLSGCGLPGRWHGRDRFTVLETGFGLGLNFLTTWAAWEADAQRCNVLDFVSLEGYPVAAADLVRSAQALSPANPGNQSEPIAAGQELAARVVLLAQELSQVWHHLRPGLHRFSFAAGHITLTLAVGDVHLMLKTLTCEADAVYLDGFSPALNPDMWSPATLQAVASYCHPGTRLASYTVAASVRAALEQLGFRVEKCPGLPPKKHRLQALFAPGLELDALVNAARLPALSSRSQSPWRPSGRSA